MRIKSYSTVILLICVLAFVVSCGTNGGGSLKLSEYFSVGVNKDIEGTMALEEVWYVNGFPVDIELDAATGVPLPGEEAGIARIRLAGDNLLVMTYSSGSGRPALSVYNYPGGELRGRLINWGRGPGEIVSSPILAGNVYWKDDGWHYCYYGWNGTFEEMNIDKSLETGRLEFSTLLSGIVPGCLFFVNCEENGIYYREADFDVGQGELRYLIRNGENCLTPIMESLNAAYVHAEECTFNRVAAFADYNRSLNRLVEAAIELNVINIYSLDGSFARSICIGDQLDIIDEPFAEGSKRHIRERHGHLEATEQYIAVIYHDPEEYDLEEVRRKRVVPVPSKSYIQIFDWEGNPLMQVKVDGYVKSFSIDLDNNKLLLNYADSDQIIAYPVAWNLQD